MTQFTTLIINSLNDMRDTHPELTFTEILYSILRKKNLPEKPDNVNTSWLLELEDEAIYKAIEKVIKEGDEIEVE